MVCAVCQKHARATLAEPPVVPPEFWQTDRMRDALDAWHIGRVVQAYRTHPWHARPLSQGTVAAWIGLTQTQLSRIENGPATQDLAKLVQWLVFSAFLHGCCGSSCLGTWRPWSLRGRRPLRPR